MTQATTTKPKRPRIDRASNEALKILVRENAELTERLKQEFEDTLKTLVRHWTRQLREVERDREQLLDVVNKVLVYGVEPTTIERADELVTSITARMADLPPSDPLGIAEAAEAAGG